MVTPKARATTTTPPSTRAKTALPTPKKVSSSEPRNSAAYLRGSPIPRA
ncbi:hypothetical protein [Micromonospora sp. WMMD980]|nr:hypothetical protein [Micromonospora sp. WMMD980]MDG4802616.1 hypothetical protein [Micromonospora sp. WMMD980]